MTGFVAGAALLASGAWADGASWDDSGMRSRYRSVLETETPAPVIQGGNRYGEIGRELPSVDAGPTVDTVEWSQRQWQDAPAGDGGTGKLFKGKRATKPVSGIQRNASNSGKKARPKGGSRLRARASRP